MSSGDAEARRRIPALTWEAVAARRTTWHHAVTEPRNGAKVRISSFVDDPVVRHRTLREPDAFRLGLDAVTLPLLYRGDWDDDPAPPGINVLDVYSFHYVNGRPEHLRSQRQGPRGGPFPIGSPGRAADNGGVRLGTPGTCAATRSLR